MMLGGVIVLSRCLTQLKGSFNHTKHMRVPTVVVRGDVLSSWLTVSDCTRSRLAQELGVSKGRISQLLTSQDEPSAHLIAKLNDLTHLPFERLFKLVRDLPVGAAPKSANHDGSKSRARRVAALHS